MGRIGPAGMYARLPGNARIRQQIESMRCNTRINVSIPLGFLGSSRYGLPRKGSTAKRFSGPTVCKAAD
jgi:hypothetical protein